MLLGRSYLDLSHRRMMYTENTFPPSWHLHLSLSLWPLSPHAGTSLPWHPSTSASWLAHPGARLVPPSLRCSERILDRFNHMLSLHLEAERDKVKVSSIFPPLLSCKMMWRGRLVSFEKYLFLCAASANVKRAFLWLFKKDKSINQPSGRHRDWAAVQHLDLKV